MQTQLQTQVAASVQTAFEWANLSFTQAERVTELALEQAKINAELAQEQLTSVLEVREPAKAIELLKAQLEISTKSLAGFVATALELGQQFQAEATAFAEGHFDQAHDAANKAIHDSLKKAPEGSEAAVQAVKAAVDASNKALAEVRKNAKNTAALAQEGLNKLKAQVPQAVKATTRRKARA